jgi:hypothetical protein
MRAGREALTIQERLRVLAQFPGNVLNTPRCEPR